MTIAARIKANPRLKGLLLWMMMPSNQHKPRLWIRWLVNPFFHKKGKGAIVRRRTRLDVFPFNRFTVGDRSLIEDFVTINNGVGDVVIGNDTVIGISSVIIGPVTVGDDVMLAQHIVISGLNHGYADISIPPSKQKTVSKPISIGSAVWIGANSVITAGVSIGKHSVIGAGSVVTKNIPAYSVAIGNPAKVVKRFNSTIKKWEKII